MKIQTSSYPRAALIGNPSDGYNGKTIAFVFSNFSAICELSESDRLTLIPGNRERMVFKDLDDFHTEINSYGYYGGLRLLKATINKFIDFCLTREIALANKNFSLSYRTDIPQRLGMAGSSAIITAALKAICEFYNISIPKPEFANLVLSVETDELFIEAGLQDRVAQAYECPVYMDFSKEIMEERGYGHYETFTPQFLPNLFIAYRTASAEDSEVVHGDLRSKFEKGDKMVVEAMKKFGELTDLVYTCLKDEKANEVGELMNRNFDLRKSISQISLENLEMVEIARSIGASAKFTGSGGAIIGTYTSESMFDELERSFNSVQIEILKPEIVNNCES